MNYISEHGDKTPVGFAMAVQRGLAADGGLYVPVALPQKTVPLMSDYATFATACLSDFCAPDFSHDVLLDICQQAFNFPMLINHVSNFDVLELFHGPTAAFKDFGARFLAQLCQTMPAERERLIMVATSGDTGSAVASAFFQQPNTRVVVLYPDGMVSERQAHQLSCWGGNITTLAVDGTFDDCQRLVKGILRESEVQQQFSVTTANSISLGRLLPQVVYYAYASLHYRRAHKDNISFIVPSGNLGNVTAAFWARAMGYPIDQIVLAQNANRTVVDYLQSGTYQARDTINTVANAMDVGHPSNFARIQHLYPDFTQFKQQVRAYSVDDKAILAAIDHAYQAYGLVLCPHSAAAYAVMQQLEARPWMVVATAHACKFDAVVEPVIGKDVAVLPEIAEQLQRPEIRTKVQANMDDVLRCILV